MQLNITLRGLRVVPYVRQKEERRCVQETSQMISIYRSQTFAASLRTIKNTTVTDHGKFKFRNKLRNKFTMFSFPLFS